MTAAGQTPGGRKPRGSTRKARCRTSAVAIKRARLKQRLLDHRLAGLSVRQAAEKVGVSKSEAQRLLDAALADVQPEQRAVKKIRATSLLRLDQMLLGLWMRARKGDEKAVAQVLRIEERRAKLVGSDAPTQQTMRLTVTGQLNWLLDLVREELGEDASQRIYRRIAEAAGPGTPAADDDDDEA